MGLIIFIAVDLIAITLFIFAAVLYQKREKKRAEERIAFLRKQACIQCGYSLKGLPANQDNCPECGCALK